MVEKDNDNDDGSLQIYRRDERTTEINKSNNRMQCWNKEGVKRHSRGQ